MTNELKIDYVATADLVPYSNNSRTHSEKQVAQVASSIQEFGFTNPILIDENQGIIAGHGRLLAAQKLGLSEVPTITLEGLTEAQRKAYVIVDNKLALNAGWDDDMLKVEMERLQEMSFDLDVLGFDEKELMAILDDSDGDGDAYTKKVDIPTYEPSEQKPEITDLYDDNRTQALIDEIEQSDIPIEEKTFLKRAAGRHTVLNFELIADYYAHSDTKMQELMENNALVIIDFQKAIQQGYVVLSDKISEQYDKDYGDEA